MFARAERERGSRIRTFACKDVLRKAFFAQICLFSCFFGSVIRYNEALDYVRKFLDSMGGDSDEFLDDSYSGDDGSGCDDRGAILDSIADEDTQPGGEDSTGVADSDSSHHEDAGENFCIAVPGELTQVEEPAWIGTRGHLKDRRVSFARNYPTTCPSSTVVNERLVDGSFGNRQYREHTSHSRARAIARARRQRCLLRSDLPVERRGSLDDAHPVIFVRTESGTLKLDSRCSWSNPGYEEGSVHWKEDIPRITNDDIATLTDAGGSVDNIKCFGRSWREIPYTRLLPPSVAPAMAEPVVEEKVDAAAGGCESKAGTADACDPAVSTDDAVDGESQPLSQEAPDTQPDPAVDSIPVGGEAGDGEGPWLVFGFEDSGAEPSVVMALPAKGTVPKHCFIKKWIVDSGCGHDLVSRTAAMSSPNLIHSAKKVNHI